MSLQRLGSSLVKHAGVTLKRILGATLSDLNFVPLWSTNIMVVGATKDNTQAAGMFKWDKSIPRSYHDGGTIISPDVVFTDMTQFMNADGGSGVGCWVRVFDNDCIFSGWYSPSLMRHHSDMILKMWKSARYLGKNLKFDAGEFLLDKQVRLDINMDNPWQPRFGNIYGAGGTSTFFVMDVVGGLDPNTRTVQIQGGIGTDKEATNVFTMQGVGFRNNDRSAAGRTRGIGLYLHQVHTFRLIDCFWTNLGTAILLEDTLYGYWEGCVINGNSCGVYARKGSTTTSMNLVKFVRCNINANKEYCLRLVETSAVNLDSVSFEGNGWEDALGQKRGVAVLHLSNIGAAGAVGLTATNCYFENNEMRDLFLEHSANRDVELVFDRCLFHVGKNAYHGRMWIRNNSAAANPCTLVLRDCRTMLANPHSFLEMTGFTGKKLGSAFYNLNNTINGRISLDKEVSQFYDYSDSFVGVFKDQLREGASNNIQSITRTGLGVYRVVTNVVDLKNYDIIYSPLSDGSGKATTFNPVIDAGAPQAVVVTCRDSAGQLVDTGFRIEGRKIKGLSGYAPTYS